MFERVRSCRPEWLAVACVLGILIMPALADTGYFRIQKGEWQPVLDNGNAVPLTEIEWDYYMFRWDNYLEAGAPYPTGTEFYPATLYVDPFHTIPPSETEGSLVMAWGEGDLPEGEYASAWKYDYLAARDLSRAVIRVTVNPPSWLEGEAGISQVSFGLQDVNGNTRSWYWNVGPDGVLPWDEATTLTIQANMVGLSATDPLADGYMDSGLDLGNVQYFIVDENAQWPGGPLPVPPGGVVEEGLYNFWYDLEVYPNAVRKWSQPPEPACPIDHYYGWNEMSRWEYGPVVADDWVCTTDYPVTDVHWWGSFIGWNYAHVLPEDLPDHFHIQIWTNAFITPGDFFHPGQVIHEVIAVDYTYEFAGWDFDPRFGTYEACFRFDFDYLPEEFFYQSTQDEIYWISISACYLEQPEHYWGWKTRPRDPASPAPGTGVGITEPLMPGLGDWYVEGYQVGWPWLPDVDEWDMAFELTTMAPTWKWEQQPDLSVTGLDVMDFSYPPVVTWLADDWQCGQSGPIEGVRIWGSWLDDSVPNPFGWHGNFTLAVYADIPAGAGGIPYSRPGELLGWYTFQPGTYDGQSYAEAPEQFYDPFLDQIIGDDSEVWQYTFAFVPPFLQQEGDIYWLAVINWDPNGNGTIDPDDLNYQFGWKTTLDQWNDAAVFTGNGDHQNPPLDGWAPMDYPEEHPLAGELIDLAFEVLGPVETQVKWTQPPEPYIPDDVYDGWDELSLWYGSQIVADDWFCHTTSPVTDIHWWGSFLGRYKTYPPAGPDRFHIVFWTDVPADDPGNPFDFSHPGEVLHHIVCEDFLCDFAGWDIGAFIGQFPPSPPEAMFEFTCYLEEEDWFWQEPDENIYWISIAAEYDSTVRSAFGWLTRPRDPGSPAPDAAVMIYDPTGWSELPPPSFSDGAPIWYGPGVNEWDMAFELTTLQQPCPGDSNCDGVINWRDIDYFVAAMNDNVTAWQNMFLPGYPTCPFSNNDVNDDGTVSWRDIDPFVTLMNTTCP
ncbi:MAG: hypothetical protein KAY37_13085 [Phycisphaerae bacterium]|nr:hypothetical protein [Phycisphaerae bacterium]